MKVKNKLKGKLIVGIAIIAVLSILGSNMLNIVKATSGMTTNSSDQTVTVKDYHGNTVSLTNPTNPKALNSLENETTINGVKYEKVNLSNASQKSDPTYGFSFILSEDTKMEIWKDGFTDSIEYKKLRGNETENEIKDITFVPTNSNQNGKFGVYIYNAGLYMNEDSNKKLNICKVNLKLTFSWEQYMVNNTEQFPFINIRTYSLDKQTYGLYFTFDNMSYATKIDIFDGDPKTDNTKKKINMSMTLMDIDSNQFFGFGNFNEEGRNGLNHINKVQYISESRVYIPNTLNDNYNDFVWFYASENAYDEANEDTVRLEFKDVNSFTFVNGTMYDPCSYHYGDRNYLTSRQYYNHDYENILTNLQTKASNYVSGNDDFPANTQIGYFRTEPYFSYDLSQPFERINDYVDEFFNIENEIGLNQVYAYKVYHYVPYVFEEQYLSNYKFTTKVPLADKYNYTKIYRFKGYNTDGTENLEEITSSFTINYNEGSRDITATANANILNKKDFYDNIYVMVVNVTEDSIPANNNGSELGADNITKTYTLDHNSRVEATSSNSAITLTNQATNTVHTKYKEIKIPITKVWNDNSNAANLRPGKITYSITAVKSDGTPVHTFDSGEITTDSNNTKEVYSGFVPLKNANEEIIKYTVEEQQVPNYSTKIEYTKNGDQITKATITNTLNEIPKATGIVNYYLKGTTQKIKESRNLSNLTIGDTLTAETYKENISHYTYDSSSPSNLTVNQDASKNIINLYYTLNKYGYTVEYYYDGVKDETKTENNTANFGEKITDYKDKSEEKYKLEKTENVPLTITDTPSNNIMKIYYITNENEEEYAYTIEYYYDGVIDNSLTETGKAKLGVTKTYTNNTKNGTYRLDRVNPTSGKIQIIEDEDKNIIQVYYEKNENPTTDAKIITKYIDKDTEKEIADSNTQETKIGEEYNTEKKDIKDYSYVSDSGNTSGTVDEPEIEVIYYYEPIREIIVKYVDKQTGEEIADLSTNNGKTGDKFDITSKKQEINGYTLVEEPTEKEATYGKDPQTFTYYYSKNSKIIVRYVDEDTGEQIEKEIEKPGIVGQKYDISDTEKNIANYYLVKRPDSLTGKYTENEQILTYYYRKDPGLANTPIPKTGMNKMIINTVTAILAIVLLNGVRVFVRYKKEEKRSIK